MKICIYSDVHWNTSSSLIRSRGEKYSIRLEHLINSVNWVNTIAEKNNCTYMICAGDFMDKTQLVDEELTALKEISWNNIPCYFLCGNHESSVSDLHFCTTKALESSNHIIIDKLFVLKTIDCDFLFLPYVSEFDRQPLANYIKEAQLETHTKPLIIISHNDIAGINYAGFENKTGFSITEIEENCDLYLNGHIHNSNWITPKILNLGSFSAHNFTNDSLHYNYGIWILDTETLKLEFIDNPFGFNFYKLDIDDDKDINRLSKLKPNSIISVRCNSIIYPRVKAILEATSNIIEHRITVTKTTEELTDTVTSIAELQVDHLDKFIECCRANITNDDTLELELAEICK